MATTESKLARLCADAGFDLSEMPPIVTPEQLAPILGQTVGALANDRYRGIGPPFVKHGRRIRYLRSDVARYLVSHRKVSA
jgi:hypothetical protein